MSEPFLGQIKLFSFEFAPKNWNLCQGQFLSISQNTALYSLLGNLYGGDGKASFALPDLRGRTPFQFGANQNGTYPQGVRGAGGEAFHTLTSNESPSHNHSIIADASPDSGTSPVPNPAEVLGVASGVLNPSGNFGVTLYANTAPTGTLDPNAIAPSGMSQPHNNMMPYLVLNYSIAMVGLFPPHD